MKTLLSTIFFSLMTTFMFSQNWDILNPQTTYYYSHSDSIHLTNTINIDSVITEGANQNYFISNKYKVCDTCDFNPEYEVIIYRYAKEFLGFGVEKDTLSNVYVIEGDSLFAQAEVNVSWQFNNELTASITNIYTDSVIGELDSLKMIALSSNDTIIISKNHGIIRYPDFENQGKYYELKGYHNDEWYYGEVYPNFWSIYDFAVGDEYCGHYGWDYVDYQIHTRQVEILSVSSISNDEIVYETDAQGCDTWGEIDIGELGEGGWNSISCYSSYSYLLSFNYSANVDEDFFGIRPLSNIPDQPEFNDSFFQTIGGFDHMQNSEKILVSHNIYSDEFGYLKTNTSFSLEGDSLLHSYDHGIILVYANNLGRIEYDDSFTGFADVYSGLIGAVINGDTIGDFCDFPFDLGIESLSINPLSIQPNPATNQITIEGNYNSLEIYSQTGQLVLKLESPTSIVDVSELSPGIYFLKATNEEKLYTTKLIIE